MVNKQNSNLKHIFLSLVFSLVEQQFAAIAKLIADNPASLNDDESLSTHRYSTISVNVPDIKISVTDYDQENLPTTGISYDLNPKPSPANRPYRIQTSLLQPDISIIRIGSDEQITRIDRESNIENSMVSDWYEITKLDDQTLDECYEVDYQLDPEFINEQEAKTNNIQHEDRIEQPVVPMKIDFDPSEYKNLATATFLIAQNEYEQIESDHSIDEQSDNTTKDESRSFDDAARTSQDQTASKSNRFHSIYLSRETIDVFAF